jgi:hypothetical protein
MSFSLNRLTTLFLVWSNVSHDPASLALDHPAAVPVMAARHGGDHTEPCTWPLLPYLIAE